MRAPNSRPTENLTTAREQAMTDHKPSDSSVSDFQDTAEKSLDAGIADESAAYENAIDTDTDTDTDTDNGNDEVAEGKWKSTDDGSGTSETD
jgi:hypothetical protein